MNLINYEFFKEMNGLASFTDRLLSTDRGNWQHFSADFNFSLFAMYIRKFNRQETGSQHQPQTAQINKNTDKRIKTKQTQQKNVVSALVARWTSLHYQVGALKFCSITA